MCDTILAPPSSTAERIMLFGKNSDRQRNEAQVVEILPRTDYGSDTGLTCTYITIPQVRFTHAVILCRPFWTWGAEMGANEHGVVIGNEGLYGRIPPSEEKTLIGMDFVRLALERAATAAEALNVIIGLLERYGQGGNCGHITPSYYHNSFMIADPTDAFVLDTVGREWLVERVDGVRAISNEYSVGRHVEITSRGMSDLARRLGWNGQDVPTYPELLVDPEKVHIGTAHGRYLRAMSLLGAGEGRLGSLDMMRILRDHDPTGLHEREWDPRHPLKYSLCIHAGSEDRFGQTTGSMVSEVRTTDSVHWVTGSAAPCISIFKPLLIDVPLPEHGCRPSDRFDANTLWWQHERLHRAALKGNFPKFIDDVLAERDALEADFQTRMKLVLNGGGEVDRLKVVADCWSDAIATELRWCTRVGGTRTSNATPYDSTWEKMNQLAGIDWL